jgi:hypothetical protein
MHVWDWNYSSKHYQPQQLIRVVWSVPRPAAIIQQESWVGHRTSVDTSGKKSLSPCRQLSRDPSVVQSISQSLKNSLLATHTWRRATTPLSTQEIPLILWNPQLHCSVQRCRPLGPVLSQISPVHVNALYLFKVYFNIILPSMPRSSKLSIYLQAS